jgi:protein-tyrosine-phosphatase
LSEVLFNSRAPESWKAYSAGSKPSGQVHPLTIETLENLGFQLMVYGAKPLMTVSNIST